MLVTNVGALTGMAETQECQSHAKLKKKTSCLLLLHMLFSNMSQLTQEKCQAALLTDLFQQVSQHLNGPECETPHIQAHTHTHPIRQNTAVTKAK